MSSMSSSTGTVSATAQDAFINKNNFGTPGSNDSQHASSGSTPKLASNQFLTFLLNGQDFGVEILQVREIRNFTKLTPIPNMPAAIKGVLNLRGTVVPIVDLRIRLGMSAVEYDRFTVIIVVNVNERIMGVVVDAVSDVLNVDADALVAAPELGSTNEPSCVTGLAKSEDRLVTLLSFERLLEVDAPT